MSDKDSGIDRFLKAMNDEKLEAQICFDLYILGEDYGIKRIGGFIRQQLSSEVEAKWEEWIGQRRDPFATWAVPYLSVLVVVACAAVLWERHPNKIFYAIWIVVNSAAVFSLFRYSQVLRKRLLFSPTLENKGAQ